MIIMFSCRGRDSRLPGSGETSALFASGKGQVFYFRKFSKDEAVDFEKKFREVKKLENINRALGFIFSRSGFTKEAEDYCRERGIAVSEDERWLEISRRVSGSGKLFFWGEFFHRGCLPFPSIYGI